MPGQGPSGARRALVVLVAALGWLLALQLLLDLRALGLLCGVLVALGGWLGPRTLSPPGRRLRLERFVSSLQPLPHCPAPEGWLEREIASTIHKVVRDFVASWYRTVSSEPAFEAEVEKAMMGLAAELRRRMGRVDRQALARRLLLLCGHHLQSYLQAREALRSDPEGSRTLWQEYSQLAGPHPALCSPAAEVGYARAAVEKLLQALVPQPHLETRTGRFVVVELVTCNVLLPAIRKMADPDSINLLLIGAFSKKTRGEEPPLAPPVPDFLPFMVQTDANPAGLPPSPRPTEVPGRESGAAGEEGEDPASRSYHTEEPFLRPQALGSLFPCEGLELESPAPDAGQDTDLLAPSPAGEFLDEPLQDNSTVLEGPAALEDGVGDLEEGIAASSDAGLLPTSAFVLSSCPDIQIDPAVEKEEESPAVAKKASSQRPSSLGKDLAAAEGPQQSSPDPGQALPPLSSSPTASISTFSFEPLSSPDGPVVIQNLRITGTITAREHSGTGFHPYTLYTVKYETALEGESAGSLQQMAYHTVNRRYREFLNLQTRLEEKQELRKFLKNIKGPKKLFPDLPFGNMDSDKVEARKSLLESFLKQLCAVPEIANSEEVQEFLALNTDARIAFVKKPFVVSRIDKIVVNAIVDTLKTAFPRSEPQSPTEDLSESEVDGKPQTDGKKANKSRLRFSSSKIAPVLSASEAHDRIIYSIREGSAVSGTLSLAAMESFIQKQEKLLEAIPSKAPEGVGGREAKESSVQEDMDELGAHPDTDSDSETALADLALDVLRLLLMDHWSWLCTESIQKVFHLLFGTLIQRWLEVQVVNLTCTQRWVQYLQLLQESIWPGGVLPAVPKPARTEEQKKAAAEQALQSLMGILPNVIQEILGTSKCRMSWSLVLESLGQPVINRHLVFCLLDILLEFLVLKGSSNELETAAVVLSASSGLEKAGISAH
ncbi:sorting nexin-19 isoform X2 [Grus americana]|uniref:sorting nexin-19 isoform X2 n=2 Tax=Grus americana TaxID=9117 RepID=UPI0024081889|nr:sorting nexin-19 isoform X2 [Grus americana]XP_054658835.1 sorting nexin-19 isoform X2 [Grus americana]XP_054658837.1 sorting nexin-19 isoform X2 [Grus americana]